MATDGAATRKRRRSSSAASASAAQRSQGPRRKRTARCSARATFSVRSKSPIIPSVLRSWGMKPIPSGRSQRPSCGRRRPPSRRASSRWPLPSTPAMPTISPRATSSVTPSTATSPRTPAARAASTRATTSPAAPAMPRSRARGPDRSGASSPTMARTSSGTERSATGPERTVRPSLSTVTRSATPSTSSSLCATRTTARPSDASSRRSAKRPPVSAGVRTAVGSSSTRIRGSRRSALRISARWRSPTPRCSTARSSGTESPVRSTSRSASARTRARSSLEPEPWRRPSARLSRTLRRGTSVKCWCTSAIPCAQASRGEASAASAPPTVIRPASGRSMPPSTLSSVVLPAPFAPSTPWTSPARSSSSAASSATTVPKLRVIPRSRATVPLTGLSRRGSPGSAHPADGSADGSGPGLTPHARA